MKNFVIKCKAKDICKEVVNTFKEQLNEKALETLKLSEEVDKLIVAEMRRF